MNVKKILLVFGTRPEAIKMAPLFISLRKNKEFDVKICVTGQHRSMLDQVMNIFDLRTDFDLNLMTPNQSLTDVTCLILKGLDSIFGKWLPDLVLVHGDTATTFATALACYYKKINLGHVEAGLRTGNIYSPWPEEANRKLTTVLAKWHFAPTNISKLNLISEGVCEENILVTGNTVIDSLLIVKEKLANNKLLISKLNDDFSYLDDKKKIILVTGHRRENFGQNFINICLALKNISIKNPNVNIVYPVHLNPNVQAPVNSILGNIKNIYLIEPQEYLQFVYLMMRSYIIITDSGGIQEEGPALGKPVLLMRDTTERPEAVMAGTVKLVGTSSEAIESNVNELLKNSEAYEKMSLCVNPYGQGDSADRITGFIKENI